MSAGLACLIWVSSTPLLQPPVMLEFLHLPFDKALSLQGSRMLWSDARHEIHILMHLDKSMMLGSCTSLREVRHRSSAMLLFCYALFLQAAFCSVWLQPETAKQKGLQMPVCNMESGIIDLPCFFSALRCTCMQRSAQFLQPEIGKQRSLWCWGYCMETLCRPAAFQSCWIGECCWLQYIRVSA